MLANIALLILMVVPVETQVVWYSLVNEADIHLKVQTDSIRAASVL